MAKTSQATNRKERIQLRVTDRTLDRLDGLAEETGISRLALGALALSVGLSFLHQLTAGVAGSRASNEEVAKEIWSEIQNMASEQLDVIVQEAEDKLSKISPA